MRAAGYGAVRAGLPVPPSRGGVAVDARVAQAQVCPGLAISVDTCQGMRGLRSSSRAWCAAPAAARLCRGLLEQEAGGEGAEGTGLGTLRSR